MAVRSNHGFRMSALGAAAKPPIRTTPSLEHVPITGCRPEPIPEWASVSPEVESKARELCAADGVEPNMMTEGGYGPGYDLNGDPDGTTSCSKAEPMWSFYIDDAVEALKETQDHIIGASMSAEEDITPHLIGMAHLSRKTLEESDVDQEEGHRLYKVWQADVRRLIEFIREYPEGMDRAFPPGCTNIDAFGNDLDVEDNPT